MLTFSGIALKPEAYSGTPFQVLRIDSQAFSLLMQIILLETGDRPARQNWQSAQIANLLQHAASRSQFWRERAAKDRRLRRFPSFRY